MLTKLTDREMLVRLAKYLENIEAAETLEAAARDARLAQRQIKDQLK